MHFRDACTYMAVVGLSTTALAAVQPYGQCGGMNFKGDATCAEGWHCVKYNDWYSQCVSGTANAPAPAPAPATPSGAPIVPTVPSNGTVPSHGTATAADGEDDSCDADEDADAEAASSPSPAPVHTSPTPSAAPAGADNSDDSCDADDEAAGAEAAPSPSPAPVKTSPTPSSAPAAAPSASTPAPNVAGSGRNGAKCSLDAAFKAKGKKYVGVATDQGTFSNAQNKQIIIDDFGCVTPENSMKWDATEAKEGVFTLNGANALVDFATENKKMIRGHTTVWHSQLAAFVSQISDKAKLEEVMVAHIKKLLTTYAGKIYAWDVVNEIFAEDGGFRSSVFYNVLGEGFVSTAFHAARQADPNAKLYINDYNLDGANYPKLKGLTTHVKKWIADGVPIDGVGSQSHFTSGSSLFPMSGVPAALKALCESAPECAMTELDIKNGTPSDWVTAFQACEDLDNCVGVTVWGVSDTNSWIGAAGKPLLFDGSFQAKPNYNELCSVLTS